MNLSELQTGQKGVIVKVTGHGGIRKRLIDMGFIRGTTIRVVRNAPLRDPVEYEIMGYLISLRRAEAQLVEIVSETELLHASVSSPSASEPSQPAELTDDLDRDEASLSLEDKLKALASHKRHTLKIVLVGNPNCGKTSLFNQLSGGHERVGNYSGVTVDAKEGEFSKVIRLYGPAAEGDATASHASSRCISSTRSCDGCTLGATCHLASLSADHAEGREVKVERYHFQLIDLPGTYSLAAFSPEERYVRQYLIEERPDVVINVVDAANLERNLYLTTQLIDMNLRVVVALNMYDELRSSGDRLNHRQLGRLLGIPMIPTVSKTGEGLQALLEAAVAVYENRGNDSFARHIHINHGVAIEQSIDHIKHIFQENPSLRHKYSTRFLAIKFLEGDADVQQLVEQLPQHDKLVAARYEEGLHLQAELRESAADAIAHAKYGFIKGALLETFHPHGSDTHQTITARIDGLVTNPWLSYPIFLLLLAGIFSATFFLGAYPMDWIEALTDVLAQFVHYAMPPGAWRDLVTDGVIGGVGSVIVFLPNILILYFFISLLEDTGYMARAAFIMDRLMHHIGLHGKSFIPMVMGFGCNVPAVMATRTIENPKSRLITMLVIPFMSCSARIPIYVVLVSAFFPSHAALVLMGLYLGGVLVGLCVSKVLSHFLTADADHPFVMELPPYRVPSLHSVLAHTWEKGRQYLRKMGGVILLFSVVIWALGYFPRPVNQSEAALEPQTEAVGGTSYLETTGRFLTPVLSPLGFNWQMSVAVLSGFGAKELVVSTLAVMASSEDVTDTALAEPSVSSTAPPESLDDEEAEAVHLAQVLPRMATPAAALAFLVFTLLYLPCVATIAAIRHESGAWRWAIASAVSTTLIAYVAALCVYRVALLCL